VVAAVIRATHLKVAVRAVQAGVLLTAVQLVQAIPHLHPQAKEITAAWEVEIPPITVQAAAVAHLLLVVAEHLLLQVTAVLVQPHLSQVLALHTLAVVVVALMVELLVAAVQVAVEQVQHLIQLQPQVQPI
jgi:hypothetical protein